MATRAQLTGDGAGAPHAGPHTARGIRAAEFTIGDREFLLDGEPFRILSGALHYFRVHPRHWADRIAKARRMGLNTIETYVAWNAHAPRDDRFDLTGGLDLGRFLDLIAAAGMYAIVRPGPYICAEWSNGGLPAWLFRAGGVGIRRDEPVFLAAVRGYLEHLAPVIVPRQVDRGGPVILVQVENEYGAYGADEGYLRKLVGLTRGIGVSVPLTTVDQPIDDMLDNGGLPELHKTGSFGSRVAQRLDTLRRHQPTGPLMCSEFWNGWFDDWGGHHHRTSVEETARDLDELLRRGASVNIYMFHGGTNFGFSNGANDKGAYQAITTSYDYDAPLDEAGNPTAKYWALRDVLARYASVAGGPVREAAPAPAFTVPFERTLPLWDVVDLLGEWTRHDAPPTTDEVGQYEGFTLYRTEVDLAAPATTASSDGAAPLGGAAPPGDAGAVDGTGRVARVGPGVLQIGEVRDRAQVFLNRCGIGVLARDHHDRCVTLPEGAHGILELLVEDQGRVDYGPRLGEPKGLIGPATLNAEPLCGWAVLPLRLTDIAPVADALRARPPGAVAALPGPAFARASFDLPSDALPSDALPSDALPPDDLPSDDRAPNDPATPGDLYLDTGEWGKGVVWINGFCLGRYWSRGPQRTLYVPGPILREAGNELIVLELQATGTGQVRFVARHDLGHTES